MTLSINLLFAALFILGAVLDFRMLFKNESREYKLLCSAATGIQCGLAAGLLYKSAEMIFGSGSGSTSIWG